MRKFFLVSFVLSAMLCLAGSSFALEKTSILDTQAGDGWTSGATCAIVYYNRCNGWSFGWSGFGDGNRLGVCADNCCGTGEQGVVTATQLRVFSGASQGYGFTGTAAITNVDGNCCPTTVLASVPYLPTGPLFDVHFWNQAVGSQFAVVYTLVGAGNNAVIGTDHPSAGPTGPQACGFCYPLTRPNHTFVWGSVSSPVCPGSVLNDGVCDAQLRLDIFMSCGTISVEDSSWGSVKNLYR